jgi:hypothetical protein
MAMAAMPLGFTFSILAKTPPAGCLELQGALVSRSAYPDLWVWVQANAPLITEAAWQTQAAVQSSIGCYSSGDGSTTFRLPKIVDFTRGSDTTRTPGTYQFDAMQGHGHKVYMTNPGTNIAPGAVVPNGDAAAVYNMPPVRLNPLVDVYAEEEVDNGFGIPRISTETRSKSVSMLWCVKAFGAAVNQGTVDVTALANEMASKVNRSEVQHISILTGMIAHGGTIPLPDGYTQAQCKWTVSSYRTTAPGGQGADVYECHADADRVVTVWGFIGDKWTEYGTANFIIIGVK